MDLTANEIYKLYVTNNEFAIRFLEAKQQGEQFIQIGEISYPVTLVSEAIRWLI